jgi:hypothetical protein
MNARTIQRIRAKLTYANVTATLALVLALGGGTAWAASKIRTRQIAYHAVTGAKLDTNSVTASKIRNGAVRTDDVKDGSLQAADLAPGAVPQPEATIWGVVTSAGALASGEGVTSAVPGNTGVTTVTFPHDVSRCAVVASVGGTTPEDERQNAAGIVHAKPGLAPEQVTFTTRSLAADNPVAELPFHFIVDC